MTKLFGGLMLAIGALASLPALAASSVLFESEPGDYIGGGVTQQFTESAWTISSSGSPNGIQMSLQNGSTSWSLTFAAPRGAPFATGQSYPGATRAPFRSPTEPGIDIDGNGRGCNTIAGWFEVTEALFDSSGNIGRLAINFKQNCEGGRAALYGALRINSSQPLATPKLRAIAGRAQSLYGKDVVLLDGRSSFNRSGSPATLQWRQTGGTPVPLNGANSDLADFAAPLAAPGGETLGFELLAQTSSGLQSLSATQVQVQSKTDPQTFLEFNSEAGDYIGGGRHFRLTTNDGDIAASSNYKGGISMSFRGHDYYSFDFGPAQGTPFLVAAYEDAQRFAFANSGHPGLDVGGAGRGCNTITGRFDVLALLLSGSTAARFASDFEQHCEGGTSALRGKARFNYLQPGAPTAQAGADQTTTGGSPVSLDGRSSSDDRGLTDFSWRQVAGPGVALNGANAALASFTAPATSTAQLLRFQLVVADADELTAADSVDINLLPGGSGSSSGSSSSSSSGALSTVTGASGSKGGGGAMPLGLLAMGLVGGLARRRLKTAAAG